MIANQPMRQFAAELRIPPEGLMHERLLAIAPGVADRERYARRMRELASDPDTASCDEFALREGERVFQGFTKPVVGAEDEYLGRVWTLREVTEARQIDRIKDALVATVSHELRTPLTSIIGYLELLGTSGVTLGDEDARYVEIVRRNAARLQHMVEELLFVARVDAEGLSLDLDNVNLSELARDAIGSALPLATAKEVALELEALPSARACVDAKRISQVLDNLISNAIKFTSTGGNVKVTISFGGRFRAARIVEGRRRRHEHCGRRLRDTSQRATEALRALLPKQLDESSARDRAGVDRSAIDCRSPRGFDHMQQRRRHGHDVHAVAARVHSRDGPS